MKNGGCSCQNQLLNYKKRKIQCAHTHITSKQKPGCVHVCVLWVFLYLSLSFYKTYKQPDFRQAPLLATPADVGSLDNAPISVFSVGSNDNDAQKKTDVFI